MAQLEAEKEALVAAARLAELVRLREVEETKRITAIRLGREMAMTAREVEVAQEALLIMQVLVVQVVEVERLDQEAGLVELELLVKEMLVELHHLVADKLAVAVVELMKLEKLIALL